MASAEDDDRAAPAPDALLGHAAFVRRLARSLASGDAEADDAAQEAWLSALRGGPRRAAGWRAWMATIVRRAVSRGRRAAERRRARETAAARVEGGGDVAESAARAETMLRLARAVAALDERYRIPVLLRFYDGLPPRVIADRLGMPTETVRVRLRRALEQLRERLAGNAGDGRVGLALLLGLGRDGAAFLPRAAGGAGAPAVGGSAGTASGSLSAAALMGGTLMTAQAKASLAAMLILVAAGWWWTQAAAEPRPPEGGMAAPRTADAPATEGDPGAATGATPLVAEPFRDDAADAASRPDRVHELHGVVLDPAGAPLAGAAVTTERDLSGESLRIWNVEARYEPGPSTVSDAAGRFGLRLPVGRAHTVRATFPGFSAAECERCYAGGKVELRLTIAAAVRGRIVTAEGDAPPPGFVVELARRLGRVVARVAADSEGRFAFADVPPGDLALKASGPGGSLFPGVEFYAAPGEVVERTLRLAAGVTLRGRVWDAVTRAPIAAARIEGMTTGHFAASDAEGRFTLAGFSFPPGWAASVKVTAAGYAEYRRFVLSDASPSIELDLPLTPEVAVYGRAIDAAGAPIAGAYATIFGIVPYDEGRFHEGARSVRTASDGSFELGGVLPSGGHTFALAADGFGRRVFVVPAVAAGVRRFPLGDVELRPGGEIEGELVDEHGRPRAGEQIEASWSSPDFEKYGPGAPLLTFTRLKARTDDLGRFRWTDLAPGEYAPDLSRVFGIHPTAPTTSVLAPGAMRARWRIVCPRGLAISGRLLTAEGDPPPDLVVSYVPADDLEAPDGYVHTKLEDGSFRIEGLAPGRYRLFASSFDDAVDSRPIGRVDLGEVDAGGVVDRRLPKFVRARGRVVDFAGRPVCGAYVYVESARLFERAYFFSGVDGSFEFVLPLDLPSTLVAEPPREPVDHPTLGQTVGFDASRRAVYRDFVPAHDLADLVLRVRNG